MATVMWFTSASASWERHGRRNSARTTSMAKPEERPTVCVATRLERGQVRFMCSHKDLGALLRSQPAR